MAYPDDGDLLWGTPLRAYILTVEGKADTVTASLTTHTGASDPHNVLPTAASDATSKVSAHVAAVDPHGDRAYADGAFITKTGTTTAAATVQSSAVGNVAFTVKAIGSQTAHLFDISNSGGTPVSYWDSSGIYFSNQSARVNNRVPIGSLSNGWGGGVGVLGITNASVLPSTNPVSGIIIYSEGGVLKARAADGTIVQLAPLAVAGSGLSLAGGSTVIPSAAGVIGAIIKGASGQTADLIKFQNSAGTDQVTVTATGVLNANNGGTWSGSPTLITPTIASFANATHDHSSAATGGYLAPSRCHIQRAATFTAANNTDQTITWDTATSNIGATYWVVGSPTLLTLPFNGFYLVWIHVVFQNQGTNGGIRLVQVKKQSDNSNIFEQTGIGPGGSSTDWINVLASFPINGTAGQQIYASVKQSSGGTMTIFSAQIFILNLART